MQSSVYKITALSVVFIAAVNAARVDYVQEYSAKRNIPVFVNENQSDTALVASTLDTTHVASVVDNADNAYVVNLPNDNKQNTIVIVVEKDKKEDKELTVAQTAKEFVIAAAAIAVTIKLTNSIISRMDARGEWRGDQAWKKQTLEKIQAVIVTGIGLNWMTDCAKLNLGKVRTWFSSAADKAIDFVQDAAESAKQQTSSAKKVVVNAFKINR